MWETEKTSVVKQKKKRKWNEKNERQSEWVRERGNGQKLAKQERRGRLFCWFLGSLGLMDKRKNFARTWFASTNCWGDWATDADVLSAVWRAEKRYGGYWDTCLSSLGWWAPFTILSGHFHLFSFLCLNQIRGHFHWTPLNYLQHR